MLVVWDEDLVGFSDRVPVPHSFLFQSKHKMRKEEKVISGRCLVYLLKFLNFHLQEFGHKVAFYHGQMDPEERNYVQRAWSKDEVNIICATVAFGMGMSRLSCFNSSLGLWRRYECPGGK